MFSFLIVYNFPVALVNYAIYVFEFSVSNELMWLGLWLRLFRGFLCAFVVFFWWHIIKYLKSYINLLIFERVSGVYDSQESYSNMTLIWSVSRDMF